MIEFIGVGWDFTREYIINGLLLCDERTQTHSLFELVPWVFDADLGFGDERGNKVGNWNQCA